MSGAKPRILIIEDEKDILTALQIRLVANGYEIIAAADGPDGLRKARTEKPDLIILDIMLPKLDGYQIARMLKYDENYAKVPILMLTAKVQQSDVEQGLASGADAYMTKPFKAEELLAEISRLLLKRKA
jgi:DNA-binding response OmpR family regulator